MRIRLQEARANGIIRFLPLKALIGRLLVRPFIRRGSRYALVDRWVSHPQMEALFDRHRPVLVVAANPGSWNNSTFSLFGIGNLSDRSFNTRLNYEEEGDGPGTPSFSMITLIHENE